MNCKPGDLCVCIKGTRTPTPTSPLGRFCTVLHAAPNKRFRLPDGYWQAKVDRLSHHWVVEWHNPMKYPIEGGGWRATRYGVMPDSALRPIRDQGGEDEILRIAGKPESIKEAV